jgi:tetratricopeptide (TPR) repeat protein
MCPIPFCRRFLALFVLAWPAYLAAAPDLSSCEPLSSFSEYHDVNDRSSAVVLNTVETNHFVKDVELLVKGQTAPLPLDIDFVLRAFPNHYRALNSMANWQLKNKLRSLTPDGRPWTADCYFQRAHNFAPKDWRVRIVYAIYLHRAKRLDEAREQYVAAEDLGASTADYYYSRGLLEVDMGDLANARTYADKAYAMGMPLPGLRDKLARAEAKQRNGSTKR